MKWSSVKSYQYPISNSKIKRYVCSLFRNTYFSIFCLLSKQRHSGVFSMSAGSSKAPVGRSKHNGGRVFRQHAHRQLHKVLSPPPPAAFTWAGVVLLGPHKECKKKKSVKREKLKALLKHKFQKLFFRGEKWVFHAQVTASGLHISKQCFLLFFFLSVWSLLLLLLYYNFLFDTFAAFLFYLFIFLQSISSISALKYFSFSLNVSSDETVFLFFSVFLIWFCVRSSWYFAWLNFRLCLISFFLCFAVYIFAFFPVLIALMVLSTDLPPYSLMLFSMANWAPQPTVLISRSTHPASSSFLSPFSINGFRCQLYCENLANSEC